MFSEENYPERSMEGLVRAVTDCRMHSEEGALMTSPEITAIIPVFNDRPALERAIPESLKAISRITENFEVIVAEDGSSDGSAEFVRQYETKSTHVKLLHSDIRQGRGKALNRAIRNAQGSIVCYYDVDLATHMKHLPESHPRNTKGGRYLDRIPPSPRKRHPAY